jgi:hypothetical protein
MILLIHGQKRSKTSQLNQKKNEINKWKFCLLMPAVTGKNILFTNKQKVVKMLVFRTMTTRKEICGNEDAHLM